jgi:membrane protease YdiL (CAAX protease family)
MKYIIGQLRFHWFDFYEFLKAPKDQKDEDQDHSQRIRRFLSLFVLNLIVIALLIVIISLVESTGLIDTNNHKAVEMLMSNPLLALFAAVIIAPLFEEIIFRAYIVKKYSPIRLIALIAGITGIKNKMRVYYFLEKYWDKHYKYVIYFSAILFGFVHIGNYEITTNILIFSPLVISPQIYIGLCLAYLRVKYGLVWAMLYHAIYNLILIGPALFFIT